MSILLALVYTVPVSKDFLKSNVPSEKMEISQNELFKFVYP